MNSLQVEQLPLILSGPILRRTEAESVTVWVALKQACQVQLTVKQTVEQGTRIADRVLLEGRANTVQLGKHLHLVAVTAAAQPDQLLGPDLIYAYDLAFVPQPSDPSTDSPLSLQAALSSTALPACQISYFAHGWPTFALSPRQVSQLKIFHGSCRRIHDCEHDALPILDLAIAQAANCPLTRPHQLFFTGDQIYGDEVAEPFLWAVLQMVKALVGWSETLLGEDGLEIPTAQLQPGQREWVASDLAGLTAGHQGKPEKIENHLLRFAEYAISYLFAWSDCLWHLSFPASSAVGLTGKAAQQWDGQIQDITQFARSQPSVRRALANIPTYMIFDDHDVSDDWNLNQAWCLRVLGQPLGRQVVRNAMLAYALFQGWGNTPEQFKPERSGGQLLKAADRWCATNGTCQASAQQISQLLGLPACRPATGLPQFRNESEALVLDRPVSSLKWHYRVRGTVHEVLVLDTRTQRGYPANSPPDALPQLLSPGGFEQQLQPLLEALEQEIIQAGQLPVQLTFLVAPTNIFSLKILDRLQAIGHVLGKGFDIDIGDSWTLEGSTRAKLLAYLLNARQQLVVLSGDIHFGGTIHLDYWFRRWPELPATGSRLAEVRQERDVQMSQIKKHTLVQFTASALCNSEPITEVLHSRFKALFPERPRRWLGWEDAEEVEVGFGWGPAIARSLRSFTYSLTQLLPPAWQGKRSPAPNRRPDWQYETYWIKPQSVYSPAWGVNPPWISAQNQRIKIQQKSRLQKIWHSRWMQTGQEIVGFNNIGLVRFEDSASNLSKIAIHELYWYAPWSQTSQIVCSQFRTSLLR
ncbi:MAG: PhoD-like phosphatase [Aphanocapsa sp. GSE-SYN-MK-11-07L]|jgi:hypothetical protein|nr:PhoD-like phosphatase [Aphanocapsa sp. GSE-SYN-MK-11-07L]